MGPRQRQRPPAHRAAQLRPELQPCRAIRRHRATWATELPLRLSHRSRRLPNRSWNHRSWNQARLDTRCTKTNGCPRVAVLLSSGTQPRAGRLSYFRQECSRRNYSGVVSLKKLTKIWPYLLVQRVISRSRGRLHPNRAQNRRTLGTTGLRSTMILYISCIDKLFMRHPTRKALSRARQIKKSGECAAPPFF